MTGCSGNVRPRVLSAAATLLCWVVLAAPAFAQTTTLTGIVRAPAPSGHMMAGVTVTAIDEVTSQRRTAVSSLIGQYTFKRIPRGLYTLIVDAPPFYKKLEHVDVSPNRLTGVDIVLDVTTQESVDVSRRVEPPTALTLPDGSIGTIFSRPFLDTMPLANGHTLQSMLSIVPGIAVTETNGTLAQFTAAGQRRFANRLTIDMISGDLGVNVVDFDLQEADSGALPAFATTGGTQTLVPLSAIEEIEVRTTNASAEYSRTPGAQIVLVTRSGSDRLSASGFTEARPRQLSATDWFDNYNLRPKRTPDYWNTGVSVGGPVLPRKLFYFGTWERQGINRNIVGTLPVPSLATREAAPEDVRPLLDAFPLPNGPDRDEGLADLSYRYPIVSKLNTLSVRLDGNVSDVHRVFTRVNRGRSSGDSLGFEHLPTVPVTQAEATATTTATVGVTSAWSSVAHELRANVSTHRGSFSSGSLAYGDPQALPLALFVPPPMPQADAFVQVVVFNGPGGTLASGRYNVSRQEQVQLVDTWSLSLGRHEWRFGIDYRQARNADDSPAARFLYRFGGFANLFEGRAQVVSLDELLPARTRRIALSMFAQDAFRVSPRLSLNLGLRYSVKPAPTNHTATQPTLVTFDTLPALAYEPRGARLWKTSWTDFGPGVAVTYQLGTTETRETTLRAGWSLVFDELTSPGVSAFVNGYPFIQNRGLPPFSPFPASTSDSMTVAGIPTYYSFPDDLRTPRTNEWQVGIEQSLGRGHRLGLAYVGAAGRYLTHWYGLDIGNREARVRAVSDEGTSDYHALVVEYVRRLSRGLQGRVAYTWGHAIDTDSGEARIPPLPPDVSPPSWNRASADYDRRQLFHATASYYLPTPRAPAWLQAICADWRVDATAIAATGAPVSVFSSRIPRFSSFDYRPDVVPGVSAWIQDPASPTGRRINPDAFEVPEEFRQGTLGRNTLRASALRQVNLGVGRSIRVRGRLTAQLRFDAFNVFNIPNFGPPVENLILDDFGRAEESYADALGTGTLAGGGLVPLQQAGGPRSVQLGLRLVY